MQATTCGTKREWAWQKRSNWRNFGRYSLVTRNILVIRSLDANTIPYLVVNLMFPLVIELPPRRTLANAGVRSGLVQFPPDSFISGLR